MWFFGGGWVLGSLEMADATCTGVRLKPSSPPPSMIATPERFGPHSMRQN
jgi:hypothetical protein